MRTAKEILDGCEHPDGHVGTDEYYCECLMCRGQIVCRPCAEAAVEAAREEERAACLANVRAAVDVIIAQAAIVVRLTEPEGATKQWWVNSGRGELIHRSIVVDAVLKMRAAIDGCVRALRERGG